MAYRKIINNKNFEHEHLQRKEDNEEVVIIVIQCLHLGSDLMQYSTEMVKPTAVVERHQNRYR